jgi:putative transposase
MRRNRHSIRLKRHDYTSAGAYFVTVCTHRREHLFGEVRDGRMVLNEFGDAVWWEWHRTEHVRPEVELDAFVVMPNHVHGIVVINADPAPIGALRPYKPMSRRDLWEPSSGLSNPP